MNITVMDLMEKRTICINALDANKVCETCRYKDTAQDAKPCSNCYNELLCMPVNPTNWEAVK